MTTCRWSRREASTRWGRPSTSCSGDSEPAKRRSTGYPGRLIATAVRNKQGILEEQATRKPEVEHLPFYYSIHLNKPCNQRCIMCVPDFKHARSELSFEGFVRLFEQIERYAEHVTLIGGETFMYPRLPEVLELLGTRQIKVTINTNATMLDDRVLSGLLGLHALNLKCSIHAATPDTYRRVHGRDHFERVTANMRRFAELSRELPDIRLITVYVVMRENLHEVVPFIDFARTLEPHRVEFHPVKHVGDWDVENGTGWRFHGRDQVCESFRDEYYEVIRQASERCESNGLAYEFLPA